jgi:hypothetical protein
MVARHPMATKVVMSVRGEHAQGLRSLGRRVVCLVSDIFTAAVVSLEAMAKTAGSAERVFSTCPCRASGDFQVPLLFEARLLADVGLLSKLLRRSASCEAFSGIGR